LYCSKKINDDGGTWTGKRNEVHIDARASDSIILALKAQKEIWVTRDVFDKVEDISEQLEIAQQDEDKWKGTEIQNMEFEIPDYYPEDEEDPGDL